MSCVIALKEDNKIYMIADSGVYSHQMYNKHILNTEDGKIIKKGKFLFGIVGDYSSIQFFRYMYTPIENVENEPTMKFLNTKFIQDLILQLKNNNMIVENTDKSLKIYGDSVIIMGYKDVLIKISHDIKIIRYGDVPYLAIGCGDDIARGAMFNLIKDNNIYAKNKLEKAMEACCKHSSFVSAPFVYEEMDIK
jgi:ATP-dependent protease HslVU (ClpYQ) peptidase subunit